MQRLGRFFRRQSRNAFRAWLRTEALEAIGRGPRTETGRVLRETTGAVGRGTAGVSGAVAQVGFSTDLSALRTNLERRLGHSLTRAQQAALHASNEVGFEQARRMRRYLSDYLSVPEAEIARRERVQRAHYVGGRMVPFRVGWRRTHFPVSELRGVRFTRFAHGRGTLSFRAYGRRVSLPAIQVLGRGGRPVYYALRSTFRGGLSPRSWFFYALGYLLPFRDKFRPVSGTWLKSSYQVPPDIRQHRAEHFRVSFHREYRRLGGL